MTITLTNSLEMPATLQQTWPVLTDVPLVASCLPGASIDSTQRDGVFTGSIGLRVGPVSLQYHGELEVVERDDEAHFLMLRGSGRDSRGGGNISAIIRMEAESTGETTRARISTDIDASGKVAQLGTGAMQQVAERMVGRLATNLPERLGQPGVPAELRPAPDHRRRELALSAGLGFVATLMVLFVARRLFGVPSLSGRNRPRVVAQ